MELRENNFFFENFLFISHAKLILNFGGWIDPPIECTRRFTTLTNILTNLYNQLSGNNSKTVISLLLFGSFATCYGSVLVFCFSLKPIILTSSKFILYCVLKNTNLPLEAVSYQIWTKLNNINIYFYKFEYIYMYIFFGSIIISNGLRHLHIYTVSLYSQYLIKDHVILGFWVVYTKVNIRG
jgi:hypothetical protein